MYFQENVFLWLYYQLYSLYLFSVGISQKYNTFQSILKTDKCSEKSLPPRNTSDTRVFQGQAHFRLQDGASHSTPPWCDKLICVNVNNQHFIIQKHSGHEDIIKDKDLISMPKTNLENKYFWLSETIWSYSSEDVQIWTSKAAKSKFCNAAIILDSESNLQDVIREACQN